ncbi:hypothetical protein Tco_0730688, partial [Tanacetum coccineum]
INEYVYFTLITAPVLEVENFIPMIAGQRKPENQWTRDERKAANLDHLINTNNVKDSELASLFGKLKYEENLIDNIYETEKNKSLVSATPLSTAFFSFSIVQDFQDSPDDEENTRSSHEYLNDLEKEYQARALLAKSKRFFKKGTQRFSSAKATDQTECHKCGKKDFARDCWSKTSVSTYQSPFQPKPLGSPQHKPELRPTKDFEAKYNKAKTKLALLSLICSTPLPPLKKLVLQKPCDRTDHRTCDHAEYMSSINMSQHLKGQSGSSSRSKTPRPLKHFFPPCIHCGFSDHLSDDCVNYPICDIYGSYDHDTHGRTRVISLRRGIKPRNPQHVIKSCKTCGSTIHTTFDHNDIEWFRRGKALQAKNTEAHKSNKIESSNARPKVVFGDDSTRHINIAESERYPPDEYLHPYEPSQRFQTNSNDVSFIEPYEKPESVVLKTKVSSDQNDQTDLNDHNDQNDHPDQTDEIFNDNQSEHSNHKNDDPIINNLTNTKDVLES